MYHRCLSNRQVVQMHNRCKACSCLQLVHLPYQYCICQPGRGDALCAFALLHHNQEVWYWKQASGSVQLCTHHIQTYLYRSLCWCSTGCWAALGLLNESAPNLAPTSVTLPMQDMTLSDAKSLHPHIVSCVLPRLHNYITHLNTCCT